MALLRYHKAAHRACNDQRICRYLVYAKTLCLTVSGLCKHCPSVEFFRQTEQLTQASAGLCSLTFGTRVQLQFCVKVKQFLENKYLNQTNQKWYKDCNRILVNLQ